MSENLKPRGVKAPLWLVPWAVVPSRHVPTDLLLANHASGEWSGREFMEELANALISRAGLADVSRAFDFGARAYAPWNWMERIWDDATSAEYVSAVYRHLVAEHNGEPNAPDSGVSHVAHAAAGALIWLWHERRAGDEEGKCR